MKNAVTIVILMVMLVQSFSKVFIVLDYQANKNYITQFLCVNKAKPQLHCEGHCYLKKQLKKAAQEENQSTNSKQKLVPEIILFCQTLFTYPVTAATFLTKHFSPYQAKVASANLSVIFHPPQFFAFFSIL